MFLVRTLLGRLVLAAVIIVVALGAFWWFAIREDNKVQEEAAPVTDEVRRAAEATPTTAPASSPAAGATTTGGASPTAAAATAGESTFRGVAYRIIAGQSEAFYLAPEKLASLPTSSVARGATKDVTGEFHITADGQLDPARPTRFVVNLTTLRSDENRRDQRVQSALETSRFPQAVFEATSISGVPAEFGTTDAVMQLQGKMTLHGVTRDLTWELKVKRDGEILSILGTVTFKYSDFGIQKPEIAGFVTVEDEVTIQVQLFAARA